MQLILNADDLGYSPAVNRATFDLYDRGRLSSASLVVNMSHSTMALGAAGERPGLALGIHLNLTKGRPCLRPERIPSLVSQKGHFYPTPIFFARALAGRVALAEVEAELRAQIERVLAARPRISHLDSHSHWQLLPRYNLLMRKLAIEYHVPRIRQVDPRRTLTRNSLWLAAVTLKPVPPAQPAIPDYLLSLHHWANGAGEFLPPLSHPRVVHLLGRPGLTAEFVVHPGLADDTDFSPDTLSADRRGRETEFMQSDAFPSWMTMIGAEIT